MGPRKRSSGTLPARPLVLVVDESEGLLEILGDVLERGGLRVRTACDGARALLLLGTERCQLVLFGRTRPAGDGERFLAAHLSRHAEIPVMSLSDDRGIPRVPMLPRLDGDALCAFVEAECAKRTKVRTKLR